MTHITNNEKQMLKAFIAEGIDCAGSASVEDMLNDNMTYMSGADLVEVLGWSYNKVGGVMASLSEKGLIVDTCESPRGAAGTDWYATDEGITIGWEE